MSNFEWNRLFLDCGTAVIFYLLKDLNSSVVSNVLRTDFSVSVFN